MQAYGTYKVDPGLHSRFREYAKKNGHTLKWLVEKLIRNFLDSKKKTSCN